MSIRTFYIHALVILSIVMVSISPACAFVSGKGVIEICAPDGTIEKVEVDSAFDPFAEKMPLSEHLEAMEQCSYCFQFDKVKAHTLDQQFHSFVALPRYVFIAQGTAIPLGSTRTLYQPRGPPHLS